MVLKGGHGSGTEENAKKLNGSKASAVEPTSHSPAVAKKTGELLVADGLITLGQLHQALAVQSLEREKVKRFNIAKYLLDEAYITKEKLISIHKKYRLNQRVGETLVSENLITEEKLKEALNKKRGSEFLGETMLRLGFIDKSQLYKLLYHQINAPSLCAVLIKEGVIDKMQINGILAENTIPRAIGEILTELGHMSVHKLNKALSEHGKRRPIGDMLLNSGLITRQQLRLALECQQFEKTPLGEVLVSQNIISEKDFCRVLAKQFALEFIDIDEKIICTINPKRLKRILGAKMANRYKTTPIHYHNKRLTLAVFDPSDMELIEGFDHLVDFETNVALVTKSGFATAFRKTYDEEYELLETKNSVSATLSADGVEDNTKNPAHNTEQDDETEKLVDLILSYGINMGASDIHLENSATGMQARYRIDGILTLLSDHEIKERISAKAVQIVSRLKVMAYLDMTSRKLPQYGSFRASTYDAKTKSMVKLDMKVAVCPSMFGENIVMHILDHRNANKKIDKLSHSKKFLEKYSSALRSPSGMILVTGSKGSGKSSTLYASLHELNNPDVKIVTAEEVVEFQIEGISQTQVEPEKGLTFAELLKSFLQLDPDIVMASEIPDRETAEIATKAALAGHLILSSLHTNDAVGTISRLRALGVSDFQIAASLKCVAGQRLLRAICEECKHQYMPGKEEWGAIFSEEPVHLSFFKGAGCAKCNNTGFASRIVISEILLINSQVAKAIQSGADEQGIYETARETGMLTMLDDALDKLDKTRLSEITRVMPLELIERFRQNKELLEVSAPKLAPPNDAHIDFQTIVARSDTGIQAERIASIYKSYIELRQKLNEPYENISLNIFAEFLHEKLQPSRTGLIRYYRITGYRKGSRSVMVAQTLNTTPLQEGSKT